MAVERTLSIIKPDAVAKNVIGQIYARFEAAGLKIVAARMVHLSRGEAEAFRHGIRVVANVAPAGLPSRDRDESQSFSRAASPRS